MQILWFCFLHWLVRSLMRCHASFSYCNSECLSDKERPQGITVVFDVDISVPLFTQQYASSGTQFGFQKHRCRRCGYNKRQTLGLQIEVKCQTLGLQIEVKCVSTKQFQKKFWSASFGEVVIGMCVVVRNCSYIWARRVALAAMICWSFWEKNKNLRPAMASLNCWHF